MNFLIVENASFYINEKSDDVSRERLVLSADDVFIDSYGVYGLKAPNGTGKTTFLNCLFKKSGYISRGSIFFRGIDIKNLTTEEMFKQGYAFLQQKNIELPNITYLDLLKSVVSSNLNVSTLIDVNDKSSLEKSATDFGISYDLLNKEIGVCSTGERKILDLFLFSVFDMEIFFIDELDANLDEHNKDILVDYIKRNKNSKVFFLISHDQEFLKRCKCSSLYTILRNKIVPVKVSGSKKNG